MSNSFPSMHTCEPNHPISINLTSISHSISLANPHTFTLNLNIHVHVFVTSFTRIASEDRL
ncbi:hypothetical protein LINPERHAP2_LOCUS10241, partial [Linum perenne]